MSRYLRQRLEELLASRDMTVLATCGPAGPQASLVSCELRQAHVRVYVPHGCDHLFNLETQPDLVLLGPNWRLHGRVAAGLAAPPPRVWQIAIDVEPLRLHILSEDGQDTTETIDP